MNLSLEEQRDRYLKSKDYEGALVTILLSKGKAGDDEELHMLWEAYSYFKLGRFTEAANLYKHLSNTNKSAKLYYYISLFKLGQYDEILQNEQSFAQIAEKLPPSLEHLVNRLLLHTNCNMKSDNALLKYHQLLTSNVTLNQNVLTLGSIHYKRGHYQQAIDLYKKYLFENNHAKGILALNVYIAMCYYKLDYYDIAVDVISSYLQANPESFVTNNLKACIHYKLFNAKSAETELCSLFKTNDIQSVLSKLSRNQADVLRHNLAIFQNTHPMKMFLQLVDKLPEAKLNLVIFYLHSNDANKAFDLIKDLQPNNPFQYILKATCHARLFEQTCQQEHFKLAQQYFQLVGASSSECDTIPGRQCMASCFFLLKQFEDVNIYLSSIKAYLFNDDIFNYNYGISLANTCKYQQALEHLSIIASEEIKDDLYFCMWLARCYIFTRKPKLAWNIYLSKSAAGEDNQAKGEGIAGMKLLQIIANDCYKAQEFYFAAKAFEVLFRCDGQNLEFYQGKLGSVAGALRNVVAGYLGKSILPDLLRMMRGDTKPESKILVTVISNYTNSF